LKAELSGIIKKNGLSFRKLIKIYSIKGATVQHDMKILKDIGFISFVGSPNAGKYMATEKLIQIITKL
jgi:hypothetical protein